jgi:hypothetical protein
MPNTSCRLFDLKDRIALVAGGEKLSLSAIGVPNIIAYASTT